MECTAYQIHHPSIPARLHYITCPYAWLIWFHLMYTCTYVQCSVKPFIKCLIGKFSSPLLRRGRQSNILRLISAFLKFVDSYLYMYMYTGIFKKAPWKHCPDQDTLKGGCALHKFTFLTFFYPGFSWRQLHFLDTPGNIFQICDCRLANSLKFWIQSMWLH